MKFRLENRFAVHVMAFCAIFLLCGCVAKRGVDFGHWAMRGERINTMRVFIPEDSEGFTGNERILLLPPAGKMPEDNRRQLQNNIQQEMMNYFSATISTINHEGRLGKYLHENNLLLTSDQFNLQEAGRIGAILDASHVLCVLVREFRPYHPQVLALNIVMVDTRTFEAAAEMDAIFDASQQEVVIAADQHMQSRLARKYNMQNLEIMLRSPSQYSAFVSANCCRALAQVLYQNKMPLRDNDEEPIE